MHDTVTIRALVCDDESRTRERILELLHDDPDITVIGQPRTGCEAAAAIERLTPDLVFLDIQIPVLDGLSVLSRFNKAGQAPVAIFVAPCDSYALRAFELHAADYLLEPFTNDRFFESLSAAKTRVCERRACELGRRFAAVLQSRPRPVASTERASPGPFLAGEPLTRRHAEHLIVRVGRRMTLVHVEDLDWIEADDYYAKLHVASRSFLIRRTMDQLEATLDPRHFVRVHRSAIVRIDRVHAMHPYRTGSHVLILKNGTRVPLSRGRRGPFEAAIAGTAGRQMAR